MSIICKTDATIIALFFCLLVTFLLYLWKLLYWSGLSITKVCVLQVISVSYLLSHVVKNFDSDIILLTFLSPA